MPRVEGTAVINRPIDEVFRYATDADSIKEWQPWIERARHTPSGPTRLGTTVYVVDRLLGRTSERSVTVTTYQPNVCMVSKGSSGPFRFRTSYLLAPTDTGTRLRCVIENEARGTARLILPLVSWRARRQIKQSVRMLKRLMEV